MYYPVFLNLAGKKCLVVGGGVVAERKIRGLLKFKARLIVVSPSFTLGILELARKKKIKIYRRSYRISDLKRAALVIGATNDSYLNQKISKEAQKNKILVNIVDDPKLCSFIVPSIVKRGPLVLAISTSGKAPALAKALRQALAKIIPTQLGKLTDKLGKIRRETFAAASYWVKP